MAIDRRRVRRALLLAVVIGALGGGTACRGNDCSDGVDNDDDGFTDWDDPGCDLNEDAEAPDPQLNACGDASDNDGDGLVDLDDPGCTTLGDRDEFNELVARCKDGVDNDEDGDVDFPLDPGCIVSLDDDEEDLCPDDETCPPCGNGRDDDEDAAVDYPDDLGCNSAADMDEFNADPTICGASVPLMPMPDGDVADGYLDEDASSELVSLECGGSGAETVFQIEIDRAMVLQASTVFPETEVDTVLYLRRECRESDSELACNDDQGQSNSSKIQVPDVEPGTYYLVVDARNAGTSGPYHLEVDRWLARGAECDPADTAHPCGPGLICRKVTPQAPSKTCEPPSCSDGIDNADGDGKIDHPDDPGCTSPQDNSESDTCPDGATCPQCGNGKDDGDVDTKVDYPADPGCQAASDPTE